MVQNENILTSCSFSPKFKAKAPKGIGVWSPKAGHLPSPTSELDDSRNIEHGSASESIPQPVWTPKSSPQSPRKEYKPVNYKHYESPSIKHKEHACKETNYTTDQYEKSRSDVLKTTDRYKSTRSCAVGRCAGTGPETEHGMPIVLRSEVEEPLQHEWYKRLFRTIHKPRKNEGKRYNTSGGYQSEPEFLSSGASDNVSDLQRHQSMTTINAQNKAYSPMESNPKMRKEKFEKKDAIAKEKLPAGHLSRILVNEEDKSVVVRKRNDTSSGEIMDPLEQRRAYKEVQAGGQPPLLGFRKTSPGMQKVIHDKDFEFPFAWPNGKDMCSDKRNVISKRDTFAQQDYRKYDLCEEERQRKYLQELQDLNARRHTDFFTPSQKSPIALNRYDNFPADLAPKSAKSFHVSGVARALYDFHGKDARELSFKKGDIIYINKVLDENWLEGELNGRIGIFPVNYLEHINKSAMYSKHSPSNLSEGQAKAIFAFQAESNLELSLKKGDLVTLTRQIDENWFEGKIGDRKGIFPVTYVEVLKSIGSGVTNSDLRQKFLPKEPSKDVYQETNFFKDYTNYATNPLSELLHVDTCSERPMYRALYKYRPQNIDELDLAEGDLIHVFEKCDDGWFVGTSKRTGCFGTFPGNYVTRI